MQCGTLDWILEQTNVSRVWWGKPAIPAREKQRKVALKTLFQNIETKHLECNQYQGWLMIFWQIYMATLDVKSGNWVWVYEKSFQIFYIVVCLLTCNCLKLKFLYWITRLKNIWKTGLTISHFSKRLGGFSYTWY